MSQENVENVSEKCPSESDVPAASRKTAANSQADARIRTGDPFITSSGHGARVTCGCVWLSVSRAVSPVGVSGCCRVEHCPTLAHHSMRRGRSSCFQAIDARARRLGVQAAIRLSPELPLQLPCSQVRDLVR